jgi:hypothetical protein
MLINASRGRIIGVAGGSGRDSGGGKSIYQLISLSLL